MNSKSFDENNYLTFVCLEDNSTIMFTKEIYYSINGNAWSKLYLNTSLKVTVGMHISFKENFREINTVHGIGYFITEGKFNILGNVNSLIFGDNAKNQTDISSYKYVFGNLFVRNTSIIDASLLKLPATTLADSCYERMFSGCTSLTAAPELPATTLADSCYNYMFNGCTSLTTAPAVLPATTLASNCYRSMFINCSSLTVAPELPATTLADSCYERMFSGCTKLNYIKMLATDTSASYCLNFWVYNVAQSGTFVKHPDMTTLPTGTSGIPSGWTVVNNGEESGGSLTFPVTLYGTKLGFANEDLGIRVYNFIKDTKSHGDYLTESETIVINATDGSRSETLYVRMIRMIPLDDNRICLVTDNSYWRCELTNDGVLMTDYD